MANKRLGISAASYGARRFGSALEMLRHAHQLGAGGIQTSVRDWDPDLARRLREEKEALDMVLEGQISLPRGRNDLAIFEDQVSRAKRAGVSILRTVALSGRRYETFTDAADFKEFKARSWTGFTLAEPVMTRHGMTLAIENHKDWIIPELLDIISKLSSAHVGVCLDIGNSISLLEDPLEVVEAYAPFTVTTHFKDMDLRPYKDGFVLSEVPLGKGFLDLEAIVELCGRHCPNVHHNLEMITRDPLEVPCLSPVYWETFRSRAGRDLGRTLRRVRERSGRDPLPKVSHLTNHQRIQAEESNVRHSLAYAREHLGM